MILRSLSRLVKIRPRLNPFKRFSLLNLYPGDFLRSVWVVDEEATVAIHALVDHELGTVQCRGRYCIGQGTALRPLFSSRKKNTSEAHIDLIIEPVGRLGNFVTQLVNASRIGSIFDQQKIKIFFRKPSKMRKPRLNRSLTIQADGHRIRSLESKTMVWKSNFMQSDELFLPTSEQQLNQIRTFVRKDFEIEGPRTYPENVLVIHIRGGDIFAENPNKDYGQPPFAFYKRVISESIEVKRVVVVSEDNLNPCVEKILEHCTMLGLACTHRGHRLSSAISEISRAKRIVTSNGTFVAAICFLYPMKRTVYSFENSSSELFGADSTRLVVRDKSGSYAKSVLQRNWANSAGQRSLMLTYAEENLSRLIEDPGDD